MLLCPPRGSDNLVTLDCQRTLLISALPISLFTPTADHGHALEEQNRETGSSHYHLLTFIIPATAAGEAPAGDILAIAPGGIVPKNPPNAPIPALAGKLPLPQRHSQAHACPLPVVPCPATTEGWPAGADAPGVAAAAGAPLPAPPMFTDTVLASCGAGFPEATRASPFKLSGSDDMAAGMPFPIY
jgi:hypothetical protein